MSVRAVVVGCNYEGSGSDLPGGASDAKKVQALLMEQLGVEEGNVTCLVQGEASPSGAAVRAALTENVGASEPGDSLFFYFSGHGTKVDTATGPQWAIITACGNVMTRGDFNGILAGLAEGAKFTAVVDASCSAGLIPGGFANGADTKPRFFLPEGGRFLQTHKYVETFNTIHPSAEMGMGNIPETLGSIFVENPPKIAELPGTAGGGGGEGRRALGWRRAAGPIGEGDEEGEEEMEIEGDGRRRRRPRRERRRRDDDEEGEEPEDEEEPEEEPAEEEPVEEEPVEEPAPEEEVAEPEPVEEPAPEEPVPEEQATGAPEGMVPDNNFEPVCDDTDGDVNPEAAILFAANSFRGHVANTEEGGAFTRAFVNAVTAFKTDAPDDPITNLALIDAIEAALTEGQFNMTPALVCSEANAEAAFLVAA